jgi:hypothetical protein
MSLSEPVLTGSGSGRTFSHGDGSSAEMKIAGINAYGGPWYVLSSSGDQITSARPSSGYGY